jgi:NTP pyrophosphatase (non-canonical NTP hydrolase)
MIPCKPTLVNNQTDKTEPPENDLILRTGDHLTPNRNGAHGCTDFTVDSFHLCGSEIVRVENSEGNWLAPFEIARDYKKSDINYLSLKPHYDQLFRDVFKKLQQQVFETAKNNGFHDHDNNDGELIALMHAELSEALEVLRDPDITESDKLHGVLAIEEELADVIIRIMDMAELSGYNIANAILNKIDYNKTRPFKHGKLF